MKFRSLLVVAALLAGCGSAGDYTVGTEVGPDENSGGSVEARDCSTLFSGHVQPRLDFCRNCHVPGGVADVEDGREFMLSQDEGQDLANLRAAWEILERDAQGRSRILTMASGTDATSHTGGAPWPEGSRAYQTMDALLRGFSDPSACVLTSGGGPEPEEQPLLGSSRAKHVWATFCEDQPDATPLPVDPRTLIRPGVNPDRAVFFNAWYENCHQNLPASTQPPNTCGGYREQRDRGLSWFLDDAAKVGAGLSAETFNDSWKAWGLSERPADFDELYTLRYGMNRAPYPNPYPLPGEDPNLSSGGSGELPQGLRQRKDAEGRWTGQIGSTACFTCHGGQVGDTASGESLLIGMQNLGPGNQNVDLPTQLKDGVISVLPTTGTQPNLDQLTVAAVSGLLGTDQRGQNNAVGAFELVFMVTDYDSVGINPNALKLAMNSAQPHPTVEQQDTPAWWNFGHRPRKFFDAGVSSDSLRILMAAGNPAGLLGLDNGKAFRDYADANARNAATWFLSLESPVWPGTIDTALAEQGAVLFHSKNLWGNGANADKPQPLGGNGSCASCHGAYSPRYVNDPSYLENPVLEGMAGHISPLEVIRTDTARADELTPYLRDAYSTTWWAFPDGQPGWTSPEDKNPLTELLDDGLPPGQRIEGACGWERGVIGYQAPPLYGVWATPPYLHNGSVPTLEAVLDSSARPALWQRKLREVGTVKGYDLSLARAYDHEQVGWKVDTLQCSDLPGSLLLNCNPADSTQPSITQMIQAALNSTLNWSTVVPFIDPTPGGADKRFVYDTRKLGNGNGGHDFTDVLTDIERRALIEYLKTL